MLPPAVLIALAASSIVEGQAGSLAEFDGAYVFAGGETERQRLRDSIDVVVSRLDFFLRAFAQGEIHRSLRPEPNLDVTVITNDRVRLSLGDWGPLDVRLDGRVRRVRGPDGGDTRLSAAFRRGRIEMRQVSARGYRDNWLSMSGDAQHLYLQVRVGAAQLPEEIRYTLSYRRVR